MSTFLEQQHKHAMRRAEKMRAMRRKGMTFEEIGKRWGISRQRVYQITSGRHTK
jgi:DNA-directed RNA polymerase sigma subunit (sigma70/sigma32)